jgi:hypothetical protein
MPQERRDPKDCHPYLSLLPQLGSRACQILLLFWISIAAPSAALAQEYVDLAEPSSILISASIIDSKGGVEKEAALPSDILELRIDITEPSSLNTMRLSANGKVTMLPRASLMQDDGTPKRIEVVLWLDPRHFSLHSGRHGLLALHPAKSATGQYVVHALSASGLEDISTSNLKFQLREKAPLNETSAVGILLLSDNELIADFSLPLTVSKVHAALSEATVDSPFRPKTAPGVPSDDAVLTLIELHEKKYVQLTFACASGMESWRVASGRYSLQDWPKYVDDMIEAGADLAPTAAVFSEVLFPTGLACGSDCSAATSLFRGWARRAANLELPPNLTVQTLPIEQDEEFAPVLMPVGMLPIAEEDVNLSLPESLQPELMSLSTTDLMLHDEGLAEEFDILGEEVAVTVTNLQDPADLNSQADQLITATLGSVESRVLQDQSSPSALSELLDPVNSELDHNELVFPMVDPVVQQVSQDDHLQSPGRVEETGANTTEMQDPADPEFEVNQNIVTVRDPAARETVLPTGTGDATAYLAYNVVAHVPLHRVTTAPSSGACANAWTVLLPPDVKDSRGGLDDAREQMRVLLNIWSVLSDNWRASGSQPLFQYARSLVPLRTEELQRSKRTSSWLMVSHYNNAVGMVEMPRENGRGAMDQLVAGQLKRKLAPPGVVLLLACQTAVPGANMFLARLIENGASTLISTSARLPGAIAGQFATTFIGVLGEAGPDGISVADAFHETLRRLPLESQVAVPRFVLAGDPNVRLCAPPLVR